MAIKMVKGLPSAGKTYHLTKLAKESLERGRPVYSNYRLGYKDKPQPKNLHYWSEPSDLLHIEKGLIVMDEAHVYFNSRMWADFPIEVQYKFQQHAKDGLDIIGSVQNEARIDVVIRELVQEWIWIRRVIGSARDTGNAWGIYRIAYYHPEDLKPAESETSPKGRPFETGWGMYTNSIARYYDTLEKVKTADQGEYVYQKYKKCSECGALKKAGFVSLSSLIEGADREAAQPLAVGLDNKQT